MDALKSTLANALALHRAAGRQDYDPDDATLAEIKIVIEASAAYRQASGAVAFNGYEDVDLSSSTLSRRLFWKADAEGPQDATVWFQHILMTKRASGKLLAAIWGLEVDREVRLTNSARLLPFEHLPESPTKKRAEFSALMDVEDTVWISPWFHSSPNSVLVIDVPDLPFLRARSSRFAEFQSVEIEARKYFALLEALTAAQPIAIGHWFEFDDPRLTIWSEDPSLTWSHAEVPAEIEAAIQVDADEVSDDFERFFELPTGVQSDLLRSLKRFALSQCRRDPIDRVLDLVLAFEIAATKDAGDHLPPSWKVSVRSAQMIGGPLAQRLENRKLLRTLYDMRNAGTHGSSTIGGKEDIIERAAALYPQFIRSLMRHGGKPDWPAIELGVVG
jgi:hypothetical protein